MDELRDRYRSSAPVNSPPAAPASLPDSPPQNAQPIAHQKIELSKPKPSKRRLLSKKRIVFLFLFIILAALAAAWFYNYKQHKPKTALLSASTEVSKKPASKPTYPIYYPTSLPDGYVYATGNAKFQNGLMSFKIAKNKNIVAFTEQVIPTQGVDLNLAGFSKFKINYGNAIVGRSAGTNSAVVVTQTTLINISTAGQVKLSELKQILSALSVTDRSFE